jgi:hypothetical protein
MINLQADTPDAFGVVEVERPQSEWSGLRPHFFTLHLSFQLKAAPHGRRKRQSRQEILKKYLGLSLHFCHDPVPET